MFSQQKAPQFPNVWVMGRFTCRNGSTLWPPSNRRLMGPGAAESVVVMFMFWKSCVLN